MPNAVDKWQTFEDANFEAGDSPVVLDPYGESLHEYPLVEGYIANDGTGSILVECAQQGTDYGDQFTIKASEVVTLSGSRVGKIRITHSGSDASYRVVIAARFKGKE